jgi:signal peptidase I
MNENQQEFIVESGVTGAPSPRSTAWQILGAWAREIAATVLPAVVIALLIEIFLAQFTIVYGQSMEPNLYEDQRLVVEKVSYHWQGPHRGDIVVFPDPSGGPIPFIKRVVGLPGERVQIAGGRVYVDGRPLDEPYLAQVTTGEGRTWTVPPMHIFVMGDNRGASRDSRIFGPVSIEMLIGHAVFRIWPLDKIGVIH